MRLLLPIIIIFTVIGGIYIASRQLLDKNSITQVEEAENLSQSVDPISFSSETLNFKIDHPTSFQAKEETTRVMLLSTDGNSSINRVSTNFRNLHDHLNDLNKKNNTTVISETKTLINNNEALIRVIMYPGGPAEEKVYNIMSGGFVYSISAPTEAIYDDLDQIAQSFRYTPK